MFSDLQLVLTLVGSLVSVGTVIFFLRRYCRPSQQQQQQQQDRRRLDIGGNFNSHGFERRPDIYDLTGTLNTLDKVFVFVTLLF